MARNYPGKPEKQEEDAGETEQPAEEETGEQESEKKEWPEGRERPSGGSGDGSRPSFPEGGSWGGRTSSETETTEEPAENGDPAGTDETAP